MKTILCAMCCIALFGCSSYQVVESIPAEAVQQNQYQPIDPLPVAKVKVFNSANNNEEELFWGAITDNDEKRKLLPIQSAQVSVMQASSSVSVKYITSAIAAEAGFYTVVMDYMKYRVEQVLDENNTFIGNGRIGVGLRIRANVQTKSADINLGSLLALGLEAQNGNLSGSLSVDVIGIDSEGVTNLIPLTSEIDQTAIQSALQALASVKAKIWDDDIDLTPHLVAITDADASKQETIRQKLNE